MKHILLLSVFVSLLVLTGVSTSFARDNHYDGRKDYYAKDGKYNQNHFKHGYKYNNKHRMRHGYKYGKKYKDRYHDNHNYGYNHSYNSYSKYDHHRYHHDNGNHYGHRHNRYHHDNDFFNTFFLGFVFR